MQNTPANISRQQATVSGCSLAFGIAKWCRVKRALYFTLLSFALSVLVANATPVRLGIVADNPTLQPAADVLTVALSTNEQVVLVERAQLDRVLREQVVASAAGRDFFRVGQLLGADGLLVLQSPASEERPELMATVIAVRPGVVLRQANYEWPASEPIRWAEMVARQMSELFPKLVVLPKDALPVSILNLRASINSPEAALLERELTRLLYDRLVRERDIFVLERRRMQTLSAENELSGSDNLAFWSGGYLLEGIINKEGFRAGTITISGRIVPPDKTNAISVEISGVRSNLTAVINELAARILREVKRGNAVSGWNPQAEADRYFEEAQWAFRWSMFREACAAIDASWALGRQDREVVQLRIKAYSEAGGDPGTCLIRNEEHRVTFGRPFQPRINDLTQMASFGVATDAEHLTDFVRAMELYVDGFQRFIQPEAKVDPAWFALGTNLVERAGWWLRYLYFTPEVRDLEDKLAVLRQLSAEIATVWAAHPSASSLDPNASLVSVKARHAAFWSSTPEQAIGIYRQMILKGEWPLVRRRFLNADFFERRPERIYEGGITSTWASQAGPHADAASPGLAGWTWPERARCPELWRAFVDELCRSTNVLAELEGRCLRSSYAWAEEDYERELGELINFIQAHQSEIVAANLDAGLVLDLKKLVELRNSELSRDRRVRTDSLWKKFEKDFSETRRQQKLALAEAKARAQRTVWFETRKEYLRTQGTYDFFYFSSELLQKSYQPDEARELLPLLTEYKARLDAQSATNAPGRPARHSTFVNRLEEQLRITISPPVVTNVSPTVATAKPPPATQGNLQSPEGRPDLRGLAGSNAPVAARFWRMPVDAVALKRDQAVPEVGGACFRDGRLWLQAVDGPFNVPLGSDGFRLDFVGVDLDTFQSELVHFYADFENVPLLPSVTREGRAFDVHDGFLYLPLFDNFSRYDLRRKRWESFQVPVSGRLQPQHSRNRMFFTSESSLLEYTTNGDFRILASNRRQPPVSELDKLPSFGKPTVFAGADGATMAVIQGRVYVLPAGGDNWQQLQTWPGNSGSWPSISDGGVLCRSAGYDADGELWALRTGATSFELLFRQPSSPGMPSRITYSRSSVPAKTNTPRWQLSERVRLVDCPVSLQNDGVWMLARSLGFEADAARSVKPIETDGWHVLLAYFAWDEPEPVWVPLRLSFDAEQLSQRAIEGLLRPFDQQTVFEWTQKGLVLSQRSVPGFWFVPKAELDKFCAEAVKKNRRIRAAAQLAREEKRRALLAGWDRDRNGLVDSAERALIIDDPNFIELEFSSIDTNRNDRLDVTELSYFDANADGFLETKELTGILVTETNVAARLLSKYDYNQNAKLDIDECPRDLLVSSGLPQGGPPYFGMSGFSGPKELGELAEFLLKRLNQELPSPFAMGIPPQVRPESSTATIDMLKLRAEAYWQSQARLHTSPRVQPQPKP